MYSLSTVAVQLSTRLDRPPWYPMSHFFLPQPPKMSTWNGFLIQMNESPSYYMGSINSGAVLIRSGDLKNFVWFLSHCTFVIWAVDFL